MTDPFSITVSVASLVALPVSNIDVTRAYVHEVRHGREIAEQLLQELQVLHYNLSKLDSFLKSKVETAQQFHDTSVLVSSTHACRHRLHTLHERLCKGRQGQRWNLRALTWPFEAKEHREEIVDLGAFAQWIHLALPIDGCALLTQTSTQVLNVFKSQLDNLNFLQKMDDRIDSIEHSSWESYRILKDSLSNAERNQILDWISTLDHKSKPHDVSKERVSGTGQWFLHYSIFRTWRDAPGGSMLWCHGIQGSGKSILQ